MAMHRATFSVAIEFESSETWPSERFGHEALDGDEVVGILLHHIRSLMEGFAGVAECTTSRLRVRDLEAGE